jgi:flagellar motor switch protein FliG
MSVQVTLSGARKAAILLLTLGEGPSSEVCKHLHEHEVEAIAKELAAMGVVASETGERVLDEFSQMATTSNYATEGSVEYAKRVLDKAKGPDASRRILDRVTTKFRSTAGFISLERADPQQLSKFILAEHPQTIALILAHLNSSNAAQLVSLLPNNIRADVLTRMANLDEISPDVITQISSLIELRLQTLGGGPSREQHGGIRAVAELFNRLDPNLTKSVLEAIETDSPDLAVSIRNLMFVFDDLRQLEDTALREIIQRSDKKVLTVALKGASEEIRNRFFSNMSKRAADLLKEEIEVLGAVRLREVEKAQQEIVAVTRKLEEEGVIVTGAAAGEAYVV